MKKSNYMRFRISMILNLVILKRLKGTIIFHLFVFPTTKLYRKPIVHSIVLKNRAFVVFQARARLNHNEGSLF